MRCVWHNKFITLFPGSGVARSQTIPGHTAFLKTIRYYMKHRSKGSGKGLGMRTITLLVGSVQVIPVAVVLASGRSRTVAEALGLITNAHSLRTIIKS